MLFFISENAWSPRASLSRQSKRSPKSCAGGYPEATETSSCSRCCCGASWWYWFKFISLGLATSSAADANKKCGGISPPLPQCRMCTVQGVCLTPQQKARFLCHLAQEWFNPPSLRAELGSEVLGQVLDLLSPEPHQIGQVQSSPPFIQLLFQSLLWDVLPATRRGQWQNIWGPWILPKLWKKRLILPEAVICVFD